MITGRRNKELTINLLHYFRWNDCCSKITLWQLRPFILKMVLKDCNPFKYFQICGETKKKKRSNDFALYELILWKNELITFYFKTGICMCACSDSRFICCVKYTFLTLKSSFQTDSLLSPMCDHISRSF